MQRTIKTIASLTDADHQDLSLLAKMYQSDTNYFYSRYSGINTLNRLDFRIIRQELLHNRPNNLKLTGQYFQRCLNSAIGVIKSQWSRTFNDVKRDVTNSDFTELEKRFLYVVLASPKIVYDFINNVDFNDLTAVKYFNKWKSAGGNANAFTNRSYRNLQKWLRKRIRLNKPHIPYTSVDNKLKSNQLLYKTKGSTIEFARGPYSKQPKRKRAIATSTATVSFNSEIEMRLLANNQILVAHVHSIKRKRKPQSKKVIALDKGLTDLITTDSGHAYGRGYGKSIRHAVDTAKEKLRKRHYFHSLARNAEESGDLEKADRIRKNNLGRKKQIKEANRLKARKRSIINKAVNQVFKEKPTELIVEDLSWSGHRRGQLSKAKRHELTQWDKGYLQERLEFKAYERRCKITTVNPAYTSQLCSYCGRFGERGLNKKEFHCDFCGLQMDADINAAKNIKERAKDKAITLYTNAKNVRDILTARILEA